MKVTTSLLALTALVVVFGVIATPGAFAVMAESSALRLTEPLDVGGTVLEPGVYVIKSLPNSPNHNLLRVTNEDGSEVFATVLSIPHSLDANQDPTETSFVYYPAVDGAPRALRTWFASDSASGGGHDIVYPRPRAMELAEAAKQPVVAYKDETEPENLETAELVVVTPEQEVTPYQEPSPAPREPKPVKVAEAREMPMTAGRVPLFGTIGLLLIGVAVGIRTLRTV